MLLHIEHLLNKFKAGLIEHQSAENQRLILKLEKIMSDLFTNLSSQLDAIDAKLTTDAAAKDETIAKMTADAATKDAAIADLQAQLATATTNGMTADEVAQLNAKLSALLAKV